MLYNILLDKKCLPLLHANVKPYLNKHMLRGNKFSFWKPLLSNSMAIEFIVRILQWYSSLFYYSLVLSFYSCIWNGRFTSSRPLLRQSIRIMITRLVWTSYLLAFQTEFELLRFSIIIFMLCWSHERSCSSNEGKEEDTWDSSETTCVWFCKSDHYLRRA